MKFYAEVHFDLSGFFPVEATDEKGAKAIIEARVNSREINENSLTVGPTGNVVVSIAGYEDENGKVKWR